MQEQRLRVTCRDYFRPAARRRGQTCRGTKQRQGRARETNVFVTQDIEFVRPTYKGSAKMHARDGRANLFPGRRLGAR